MTEQEALKHAREYIKYLNHSGWEKDFDAIHTLIVATEQIQEYRVIGTVEELKFIKQWKEDVVEGFCKYDANSIEELVENARNKAIDELTEKLLDNVESFQAEVNGMKADLMTLDYFAEYVLEIAEQMKGV